MTPTSPPAAVVRPVAALLLLIATACGQAPGNEPAVDDQASGAAAAQIEPPDGVPAGTSPLPLPEAGKAYNNPQPRDNIRDGGTLTLPIAELGPNFNTLCVDGMSAYGQHIMYWIAPRLWDYSVTGVPSPNPDFLLSAELISDAPETVKYTLNPAAKWNDGTPIDWRTFETTWRTQSGADKRFNPGSTAGYSSIESVRKCERDNEVVVIFREPTYPFEYVFNFLLHPKNADPDFFKTGWVNDLHPELLSGPFMVESLGPEDVVLVRNPKWWGDPAKLDRVTFRRMEDIATVNAYQNGEVDTTDIIGNRATADCLRQISGMQNAQIRRGFGTSTSVYTMGQDSGLFKDPDVRKAFVLGTDRSLLVAIRFQGLDWKEEAPGSVMLFTWEDGYRDNVADLHYDPAAAKKLLDAAGWTVGDDGFRRKNGQLAQFHYVTFGDTPAIIAMARAQQKMASDIGLKMDIDARKSADFSKTLTARTFDVVAMGWTTTDPFGYVQACQIFCSDSESNYSKLGDPMVDALIKGVGEIRDRTKALAAFNEAERQALHFIGTFPLYNGPEQIAVKKGLANFGPAGFLVPAAEDIGWQK
jgi:peptide/nickel transport system substrate-binding protein